MEPTLIAAIAALFGLLVGGTRWVWSYVVADFARQLAAKDSQIAARDEEIRALRAEIRGFQSDDRDLVATLQRTIESLIAEKSSPSASIPARTAGGS